MDDNTCVPQQFAGSVAPSRLALETGIEELPFWRDQRDDDPDPRYLLPVSNGLLD